MLREAKLRSGEQFAACSRATLLMDITPTFSHTTALQYQGVAVPDDCTLPSGLHISFENRGARRRFDGTHAHYWSGDFQVTLDERGGFYIANPAMAWAQMAAHVSEESLMVIGGALICRDPARKMATLQDLRRYVTDNRGFKGRRQCESVLPLLVENVDSPPETRLVALIMKAGLGRPQVGYRVELASGGHCVADAAFPDLRLDIEYQGAYHADPLQMRKDIERWNRLRDVGWEIMFVTGDDMRTEQARARLIERIRSMMMRQAALRGLSLVL